MTSSKSHAIMRAMQKERGEKRGKSGKSGSYRFGKRQSYPAQTKVRAPGERSFGGGTEDLHAAARGAYQNAVHNRGDRYGNKALKER